MTFKPKQGELIKLEPVQTYQMPLGSTLQSPRKVHPIDSYMQIPEIMRSSPRSNEGGVSVDSPFRIPQQMTNLRT